ncbi:MAG: hypothetical protein ACI9LG_002740 [Moritella dasanensis]|jgi:hypothetical protein
MIYKCIIYKCKNLVTYAFMGVSFWDSPLWLITWIYEHESA